MVAAQGEHRGVFDCAFGKNGDVGGSAADIHQADPQFLFIGRKCCFGGCQLLQNDVCHIQAGAIAGLDNVLGARHCPCDDMHLSLQADAAHAERFADTVLLVDDEFLGEDVNDLTVHGDGDCLGGVDHPAYVLLDHLAVFDGDHTLGVDPLDMTTGDAGIHRFDLATGHQLGLADRFANRADRAFDVDDHTFAQAAGRACADADDINSVLGDITDNGTDLGCTDIKPDYQVILFGS